MIKEAIEKLMQAENLTYDQVKESVDEIMTGQASPALIASFLTALSIKGETDEEIAGAGDRHVAFPAVHQFLGVGNAPTKGLANGLVSQAYPQHFALACQGQDQCLAHPGVCRSARSGGEDHRCGVQRLNFRYCQVVVADHLYLRVQAAYILIQIVGKGVVIINQ